MNKDFWERIDRLEELAQKLPRDDWEYESWNENIRYNGIRVGVVLPEVGSYIAAANPAMIQEMIATFKGRLSYLEHKLTETDIQLGNAQEHIKQLEKEADWLAEMPNKECPIEAYWPSDGEKFCTHLEDVRKCQKSRIQCWREAARKAVANE